MDTKQFSILIETLQEITGALIEVSDKIGSNERKPEDTVIKSLYNIAKKITPNVSHLGSV